MALILCSGLKAGDLLYDSYENIPILSFRSRILIRKNKNGEFFGAPGLFQTEENMQSFTTFSEFLYK